MLVSVVALAVGLLAGGVVLVAVLNFALLRAVNTESLDTASGVARLVNQNQLSQPIPVSPDVQVQVVDEQGRVRASSATADRLVPILYPEELSRLGDRQGMVIPGDRIGLAGQVRVVSVTAGPPTDAVHVLVARSIADVSQGVHLLRITLLIAFPLLVALLAAISWRALGAALGPVEALRSGAEEITGGARPGRLPVPNSNDEIHRLAVTLNDMLHRLDAARARQRVFVADAAHELRSPLTNMRTELEVAMRLSDRTDWPALAGDLLVDVERLSRLVSDLLLLARIDDAGAAENGASSDDAGAADNGASIDGAGPAGSGAGAGVADTSGRAEGAGRADRAGRPGSRAARVPGEPVDLGDLLAEVAGRYPAVRYTPPDPPLCVTGNRDELGRVMANLLDNAVRYAAGSVELTVAAGEAYRMIVVADDGPGIPDADRERVFDRFTRLDDARARDAGGTGLGLAIVRELVRRHGGTVTLGDAGPGLRVEIRLPAPEESVINPIG
ncbi:MAG TPA: HAMP domain-containing sensor histidine kinase [Actinoplanes sp.]|nr:HAMP domain-containing sensor histidine kinase [Actinoplanes sp.]